MDIFEYLQNSPKSVHLTENKSTILMKFDYQYICNLQNFKYICHESDFT